MARALGRDHAGLGPHAYADRRNPSSRQTDGRGARGDGPGAAIAARLDCEEHRLAEQECQSDLPRGCAAAERRACRGRAAGSVTTGIPQLDSQRDDHGTRSARRTDTPESRRISAIKLPAPASEWNAPVPGRPVALAAATGINWATARNI